METDLAIDRNSLDLQLEQQPTDMLVWTRAAAEQLAAVRRAENNLKLIEAKTSINIRQRPEDYGFAKVTEELVKTLVLTQPEVIAAQDEVLKAKTDLDATKAVVDSLDAKRSSLKYLAELTVAGYLGSMSVRTPAGVRN
jgi:hypothetical protein